MMNAIAWTALGAGLVVATGMGLVFFGSSRWHASTEAQMALLEVARVSAPARRYDANRTSSANSRR